MQVNFEGKIRPYIVALLLSFEIALSFSAFGFITIGNFSLSLLPIFIYVLAYCFGTVASLIAGLFLGLNSIWATSIGFLAPADVLYSPFDSGNPIGSLILAIGVRLLIAIIASHTFQHARKEQKHPYLIAIIAVIVTHVIYTSISMLLGGLLFPQAYRAALNNIENNRTYIIVNLLIECTINCILMIGVVATVNSKSTKQFIDCATKGINRTPRRTNFFAIAGMTVFFAFFSIGVGLRTLKFVKNLLINETQKMPQEIAEILKQISWQQQTSNLALSVVILIIALLVYYYFIELENSLNYKASLDLMTNVYNRETTRQTIEEKLAQHGPSLCALIIIDIDDFKTINDTYGHTSGDDAVIKLAKILSYSFKDDAVVGRVGGDEFMVFWENVKGKEEVDKKLKELQLNISTITLSNTRKTLECSIGVSIAKMSSKDIRFHYGNADIALYKVKAAGKNNYAFFEG